MEPTPWSRGLPENVTGPQLPKGSLPHSQEPATCPYPEKYQRITPSARPCKMCICMMTSCLHHAQHHSWRTVPCRRSLTAYLMHSQPPSISGGLSFHSQNEDSSWGGNRNPNFIVVLKPCNLCLFLRLYTNEIALKST